MGNTAETERRSKYIFGEVDGSLRGMDVLPSVMEGGVLVGNKLFVAFLGWEKETGIRKKPVLGVTSLTEGQNEVSEENLTIYQVSPFKKYALLSRADGLTVFLMVKRGDSVGNGAMFIVDSEVALVKAKDAGINFVRAESWNK